MKQLFHFIDNSLVVLGVVIGIETIETILGILLLVVQFGIIIVRFIMKIKSKGKIEKEDIEELQDSIDDIKKGGTK